MKLTVTEVRAEKETQVHELRSDLEPFEEVKEWEAKISADPENPELWMKKGLALSKQMLFREAVAAYSTGLSYAPFHALLYRHRGHRLISIRRYSEARADFTISSRIDPSNWDTWYHLGLANYLLGDFSRADAAYTRCLELTDDGHEGLVAIVDWKWLTLMRLGKTDEAKSVLERVTKDTEAGENTAYKNRVLVYKGEFPANELLDYQGYEFADLELATQGYGLAVYYYYNGEPEKTFDLFSLILEHDTYWSAFGYLAALEDKERIGKS